MRGELCEYVRDTKSSSNDSHSTGEILSPVEKGKVSSPVQLPQPQKNYFLGICCSVHELVLGPLQKKTMILFFLKKRANDSSNSCVLKASQEALLPFRGTSLRAR